MASFGRVAGGRCMQFVLVCTLLLMAAQQRSFAALDIAARVRKLATGNDVRLESSNDYYEFHGRNITIYCYCLNDSDNVVQRMSLRHNESPIPNVVGSGCISLVHDLRTINPTHEGQYTCVFQLNDGTFRRANAGYLHPVDPAVVQATRVQYGLLNAPATLNCSANTTGTVTITWKNSANLPHLGTVQLSHEAEYRCEAFLSDMDLVMEKSIQFVVIVPPNITSHPNSINMYTSNGRQNFSVHFQSKALDDTHISWYKDGTSIQDSIPVRSNQTALDGRTELIFDPIRRSDGGQYRVVIENIHPIIPIQQRIVEARFTVKVTILPSIRTNLSVRYIADRTATLEWRLPDVDADNYADNQTVVIMGRKTTLVQIANDTRTLQLDLIPAQDYTVHVVASNQDGNSTSEAVSFRSHTGAPSVLGVEVRRSANNNHTLLLTATLEYTGGGSITYFLVSFRPLGADLWVPIEKNFSATAVDNLIWTAQVEDDRFQDSAIELRVSAVNSNSHISDFMVQSEELVLPGVVEEVDVVSSDYESVVLRLVLSAEGTAPLTSVEVEFHSPQPASRNVTGLGLPGSSLDFTLSDLEEDTEYIITLAVYNYGGKGNSSQQISVTTRARPPLELYGVALVAVSGAILLLATVVMIAVIWWRCSIVRRSRRAYSVAQAEGNQFPPDHDIVKHGQVSGKMTPLSPVSPTPPTPSTTTSILTQQTTTPRPSPPGFFPTPPYCSSSAPYLPHGHVHLPAVCSHAHSAFKFDAGSSRSNSVNQDSDASESSSPRYTYTFPRSVEGTPQVGRAAYDKVDLPLDLEQPDPPQSRRGQEKMGVQAHHVSHERMRYCEQRGRPSHRPSSAGNQHKVAAYVDMDSPQLRTQSSHSVATTQTRLTSSDSVSTRESLAYPLIKNNTTNV